MYRPRRRSPEKVSNVLLIWLSLFLEVCFFNGDIGFICVFDCFFLLFICCQVGTLSIEGSLYIRDPKKNWKQSLVCLKNGYMSVNKERGVQTIPFVTSSFCIWRFVSKIEAILFVLLCLVFLYL